MRFAAALLPLLALAACATPREACINDATRDLRQVNAFIAETQANLARGYALETRQEARVVRDICEGTIRREDGTVDIIRMPCERTELVDVDRPVPIDLTAERAKLASLLQQQAALERQSQAVIQACVAAHPE